ncbi:MAG TPA: MFS transporter [Aestuariivirgaceae bacterium]|nr:MFS transporter [Aestuariivirgaceae bacterium]
MAGGATPNVRWRIAALLFFATVINYIDRQTLSVLAPEITAELGLTNIEYSNIVQAFLISYASMYIVWGLVIDRWGTRTALAVSMVWWSLANAGHALARGAVGLGVFRALLGIGESGNFLAAEKAISEWFPPKERGFANGLVNAAAATGAVLAPPLIVWIFQLWGWRPAFVITGAMGFVWMAFWLRWYWVPALHPRVTAEERELIEAPAAQSNKRHVRWRELFGFPQTWALFLARVVADPVWWFYLFWLPKYLSDDRGFTMVEIGMVAWMPYLTADLGAIAGGWASGQLIKRGVPVVKARKWIMLPSAALMPLGLLVAYSESSAVAMATICVITFAHMSWKTNLMTMTNDIYPTSIVGSVAGIVGLGSSLGGVIFTRITGIVVENYSYATIFVLMAFLHPVALLILNAMIKRGIDEPPLPAGVAAPAPAVAG